jgi:hypothetical protein
MEARFTLLYRDRDVEPIEKTASLEDVFFPAMYRGTV